jgi:hypothetical protein
MKSTFGAEGAVMANRFLTRLGAGVLAAGVSASTLAGAGLAIAEDGAASGSDGTTSQSDSVGSGAVPHDKADQNTLTDHASHEPAVEPQASGGTDEEDAASTEAKDVTPAGGATDDITEENKTKLAEGSQEQVTGARVAAAEVLPGNDKLTPSANANVTPSANEGVTVDGVDDEPMGELTKSSPISPAITDGVPDATPTVDNGTAPAGEAENSRVDVAPPKSNRSWRQRHWFRPTLRRPNLSRRPLAS